MTEENLLGILSYTENDMTKQDTKSRIIYFWR